MESDKNATRGNDKPPVSSATTALIQELLALDEEAEELGAEAVQKTIACAIEDLPEAIGKEHAQKAIFEVRRRLADLREAQYVSSSSFSFDTPISEEKFVYEG